MEIQTDLTDFHRFAGPVTALRNTDIAPKQTQNSESYHHLSKQDQRLCVQMHFQIIQINFITASKWLIPTKMNQNTEYLRQSPSLGSNVPAI